MKISLNRVTWICLSAAILTGCGDKPAPAPAPAPAPREAPAVGPAIDTPPPVDGVPATTDTKAPTEDPAANLDVKDDPIGLTKPQALELLINDFITQYGRPPYDLEELVAKKLTPRLPKAPPGKKFALDKEHKVIVVDQ